MDCDPKEERPSKLVNGKRDGISGEEQKLTSK
jgi:hypothetical protein